MNYDDWKAAAPAPGTVRSTLRYEQCHDCGEKKCDVFTLRSNALLCAKCLAMQDDRRNSPPDDYSGEAA
jgi:hypothetical protein